MSADELLSNAIKLAQDYDELMHDKETNDDFRFQNVGNESVALAMYKVKFINSHM